MVLLSFPGILLFSTLLGVIAAPVDKSSAKGKKISRASPTIGGSTVGGRPGKVEWPVQVELLRQYDAVQSYHPQPNSVDTCIYTGTQSGTQPHSIKQSDSRPKSVAQWSESDSHTDSDAQSLESGSQPKSVKQSVSPSRKEAPLWGEALSPVIHFDLPPMWQERWSLLFSMPNGWCKALLSVKGTRSIEPCPTNPQGRKIIASLPKFSDPQARRVFMMDLLSEPASAVDVASSVNEACAGDVEYFNNVVKGPLKDRIGKVPEEWKGIYEPMHEVMIHGNGLWHGPNGAGWAYYNPTRSQWFMYDHAPQYVEDSWDEVQRMCSGRE